MPRSASYVRLRGSESSKLEEQELEDYEEAGIRTANQDLELEETDRHGSPPPLEQSYPNSIHEQEQKQLEDVNVSKGLAHDQERSLSQQNHNHETGIVSNTAVNTKVEIKQDVRLDQLKRVPSFRDNSGVGPKLGKSQSGRWLGSSPATEERTPWRTLSGRWKGSVDEQWKRSTSSPLSGRGSPAPEDTAAANAMGQWAASIQKVNSYRESLQQQQQKQQQQQQPQQQVGSQETKEDQSGTSTLHPACQEPQETPVVSQRFQRVPTKRFERETSGTDSPTRAVLPPTVPRPAHIMQSQRSFSMRETPTPRADNLPTEQAPRRKSSATAMKPRVSFSEVHASIEPLADHSANGDSGARVHEKWRESPAAVRQAKQINKFQLPSLPYNYEQPGFVERKSAEGCGRSYSNGGGFRTFREESSRQPPMTRTFSMAERGSTYRRMMRTFTFGTPKLVQPLVMECVTCGRGLGIVVKGIPDTDTTCPTCKSGSNCGRVWSNFPERTTTRSQSTGENGRKTSILDYCRKLFGLTKRY